MKGIYAFLAISLIHLVTANSQRSQRHHYLARTSFCKPCFVNTAVEVGRNPPQEDCPGIPYPIQAYKNALTNEIQEIREILENEKSKILRRHVSHPDFIPTRIPILEDIRISPLINILIPRENNLDQYTTLVYGNLTVLASHLHVVSALGNVGPDINHAYIKFSHALCRLKQIRESQGLSISLSNMCNYSETISLFSKTEKVDYSISVLKYGVDMLAALLTTIQKVELRETQRC